MRKFAVLLSVSTFAMAASAGVTYIDDDFESYANTAALDAVWTNSVGTSADTFLDLDPLNPLNQVVQDTTVTSLRVQEFGPSTGGLIWSFDYYDTVGNASDPRNYGQLLADNGGLSELLSMGQYNAAVGQDSNKYQARVAFGGAGWFNLNADRSIGWHNFKAVIGPSEVDFWVDGVLDTANLPHNGGNWYQARIGSALSSAGGAAYYDNYSVAVPEPTSLALLALGGLFALRRRS